ncbi:hypothetical protein [Xenorhabdus bovienii]
MGFVSECGFTERLRNIEPQFLIYISNLTMELNLMCQHDRLSLLLSD